MKDHSGCERGFHHVSKAWYGKTALQNSEEIDEVMVGFYHPEGGTTGEFGVRWLPLDGDITPKLEVFNDAWHALYQFQDLLGALAELDEKDITPAQFCELLLSFGIKDLTSTRE
jgi:hypothetical protein